jgi:hypothetical protein
VRVARKVFAFYNSFPGTNSLLERLASSSLAKSMKNVRITVMATYVAGAVLCHAQFHTNTITTPDGQYAFSVDGSPP